MQLEHSRALARDPHRGGHVCVHSESREMRCRARALTNGPFDEESLSSDAFALPSSCACRRSSTLYLTRIPKFVELANVLFFSTLLVFRIPRFLATRNLSCSCLRYWTCNFRNRAKHGSRVAWFACNGEGQTYLTEFAGDFSFPKQMVHPLSEGNKVNFELPVGEDLMMRERPLHELKG